jgi:hypothetical protein
VLRPQTRPTRSLSNDIVEIKRQQVLAEQEKVKIHAR